MLRSDDFRLPEQWSLHAQEETVAMFVNEAGDTLSLNYFGSVPDIGCELSHIAALRGFYRAHAEAHQVAMIELDTVPIGGVNAVRAIFKIRLQPTGFAFIGNYTLPFADHSYVIKAQCLEQGTTGIREAVVIAKQGAAIETDEATGKLMGWEQDPYEPEYRGAFMRNQADDPKYGALFPAHPLSRLRGYLLELQAGIEPAPGIRLGRPFRYGMP